MVVLAILGGVVGFAALLVVSSILNGYALSVLWGWFVVPVFHLPQLSIVPAIGIAMMVGYLAHQMEPDCVEKERTTGERIARAASFAILKPLFALLFGWIVHLFM